MDTKRQFDAGRAYKLLRVLVLIITIPTFLLGIYGLINHEKNSLYILQEQGKCIEQYKDNFGVCLFYTDMMNNQYKFWTGSLMIGILLPLIFFGGSTLLNFLFPKKG